VDTVRRHVNGELVEHTIDGVDQLNLSLAQKAKNLARAGGRVVKAVVKGRRVVVSDEERDSRLEICQGCEFFSGMTCLKCGCIALFKSRLATEHCPLVPPKW
jgi:hypothetical protein